MTIYHIIYKHSLLLIMGGDIMILRSCGFCGESSYVNKDTCICPNCNREGIANNIDIDAEECSSMLDSLSVDTEKEKD